MLYLTISRAFERAKLSAPQLSECRAIISDPTILEFVTGVKIEFTPGLRPEQNNVRSGVFNRMQHVIVANEMEILLSKGVVMNQENLFPRYFSDLNRMALSG